LWLVTGYLGVWAGVSVAAALVQEGAGRAAALSAVPEPAGVILAGLLVGAAGLYQFSDWKMACLGACRHPLPDLEQGFALDASAVLRLGVGQGVRCLGCCGPMMAIMLVAGAMNLAWMGVFALLMTIEKVTVGVLVPRAVGVLLVVAGVALGVSAFGPGPLLAFLLRS
jgi:predicted metal-binding membrane protein